MGTGVKIGEVLVLLGLLRTKKENQLKTNTKLVDGPFEGMDVLLLL